jgi:hypothetical protein
MSLRDQRNSWLFDYYKHIVATQQQFERMLKDPIGSQCL